MFGRHEIIEEAINYAQDVKENQQAARLCFLGAPGTGKTSILRCVQGALREEGWLCGYSEASPNASTAIEEFLEDARQGLPKGIIGKHFLARFSEASLSAVGFSAGIKIADTSERPLHGRVRDLFAKLGSTAKKSGTGVAILIDEAQALPREDIDLLLRMAGRLDEFPIIFMLAGLPGIPGRLGRMESHSTPMGNYVDLNPLSHEQSKQALSDPITGAGGIVAEDQLDRMAVFAEGHPMTLQLLGSTAWSISSNGIPKAQSPNITQLHIDSAIKSTGRQLRLSYHEPMWIGCNEDERGLLAQLVSLKHQAIYEEFVQIMRKSMPHSDEILYELKGRGVVAVNDESELNFSIPGFRSYIQRQTGK